MESVSLVSISVSLYYGLGITCFILFSVFKKQLNSESLIQHGKTLTNYKSEWQVRKQLFFLFYAIGILVTLFIFNNTTTNWLLLLHLLRRLVETIIWPYSENSKMHILHALVGLSFYPAIVATFYLSPDTPVNGEYLFLFFLSTCIQSYCHWILFKSRLKGYEPLAEKYLAFKHILCPHYLAEISIYFCFASFKGFDYRMTLALIFVAFNLVITADSTRRWYMKRYPRSKYRPHALIPFIW